ncbi:MAG: orotidine 5'-phosphate decarboxylase, partial [Alphaproteobacteria bacterium]|nr:orotidine 5'-phosphate decarboxylase [Alphaproteobacteria bacterium]
VMRLARLTHDCGLAGIVCSAHEIAMVRAQLSHDFVLMVPGIRPPTNSATQDDQKRTMTPAQALDLGATHLVIGRPMTGAEDPLLAAQEILQTCS